MSSRPRYRPFGCLSCFTGPRTFAVILFSFSLNSAGRTMKINAGTRTTVQTDDCVRAYGPVVHIVAGNIQTAILSTISSSIAGISTYGISIATVTGPTTPGVGGDTKTKRGLSAGASAGIGVGSGVPVILIVGVALLLFRR